MVKFHTQKNKNLLLPADLLPRRICTLLHWITDKHMGHSGSSIPKASLTFYLSFLSILSMLAALFFPATHSCSKFSPISGEVAKRNRWRGRLQDRLWWHRYNLAPSCMVVGLVGSALWILWLTLLFSSLQSMNLK